jgi:spore maturation protein CgeB
MTRIAIVPAPWWERACNAQGVEPVTLPLPGNPSRGLYAADLKARARAGRLASQILERDPIELILDSGGAGLTFVEGPGGFTELKLTHERAGVPLVSHLTDPILALHQALPWEVVWQCLGSRKWLKAVADCAHADELRRFGIDNVVYMPVAAVECEYDTAPINEGAIEADVAFVGDAPETIFAGLPEETADEAASLDAFNHQLGRLSFFRWYHELQRLAEAPTRGEPDADRSAKALAYFQAKNRFARRMSIEHRGRLVARLWREFPQRFRVTGRGWKEQNAYRVSPLPTSLTEYINQYRTAAVNVSLWDGVNEATISPQHFEITAAGGFLLCPHHREVSSFFEIGEECDTFRDEEELVAKIEYYLAHSQRRRAIARAGQRRTLGEHLYRNRLNDILTILERVRQRAAAAEIGESEEPAIGLDSPASEKPAIPIRLDEGSGKLLVILNPGRFTRYYLQDMVSAAVRLGLGVCTYEISDNWAQRQAANQVDEAGFIDLLRRERVRCAISCGPNGFWEWPCGWDARGRMVPFFERMGIPHICWWTDHPQWNNEKQALNPDLQPLLESPNIHHFVKSEMAAAEIRDLLGWPNCHGLPVAEDAEGLKPVRNVAPEFDIVAVIGSVQRPVPELEPFLEHDDPDVAAMTQIIARSVLEELGDLWNKRAPESIRGALKELGCTWVSRRVSEPLTGSYWLFTQLERQHREASLWLRENYQTYFDAITLLWRLFNWQRTFILMYLARHFNVGVLGSDWSAVGLGGGQWVEHHEQAEAYARGKIALNISQAGDEEGISHKPFQIAASGVCLLHNNRKELSDCFAPDLEVTVFDTPREARDKVAELLADEPRRQALADAARARLCRDHTWLQRLPQMLTLSGVDLSTMRATPHVAPVVSAPLLSSGATNPTRPEPALGCAVQR